MTAQSCSEAITRGVLHLMEDLGLAALTELRLKTGRRVDIMGLGRRGLLMAVEVKSSRADFVADAKWPEYLEFCDQFYFAVAPDFPRDLIEAHPLAPQRAGLIIADAHGAVVAREAPTVKLNGHRRNSVVQAMALAGGKRLTRARLQQLPRLT